MRGHRGVSFRASFAHVLLFIDSVFLGSGFIIFVLLRIVVVEVFLQHHLYISAALLL